MISSLLVFSSILYSAAPSVPALHQSIVRRQNPVANASQVDPAKLISQVLLHYATAQSLVGVIQLTVKARGQSQVTTTDFQYQRPQKLYINQSRPNPKGGTWIVTSDGNLFSYPTPDIMARFRGQRMVEQVNPSDRQKLDIAKMYGVTLQVLPDFSAPMSIAISWNDELKRILKRWLTMKYFGEGEIGNQKVYRIGGDYSEFYAEPATGKYEIDVTPDDNILRYSIVEYVGIPDPTKIKQPPIKVTETWLCNLQINAKPDDKLFKVLLNK